MRTTSLVVSKSSFLPHPRREYILLAVKLWKRILKSSTTLNRSEKLGHAERREDQAEELARRFEIEYGHGPKK